MLYEVRILDPKGNIGEVIYREELSRRYWKDFFKDAGPKAGKGKARRKNKKK